jgi:CRISPR system Cascade subunit CasA
LTDPLLRVRKADGQHCGATLPGILSGLVRGEIVSFEALQPHQRQAWHSFLVQLAAIALARTEPDELPEDAGRWADMLLDLTGGEEAPWCLVVPDVSRPAFMQSPVLEKSLEEAGYTSIVRTPDELDVLITSRNHDIKLHRIDEASPEYWIYSLITHQTLGFYSAAGSRARYYHIIRVNSSFGNRPFVGMSPTLEWSGHFLRDLSLIVAARQRLIEEHGYDPEGPSLLWLAPWDGRKSSSLPWQSLDPLFIEVCHRIRICHCEGRLVATRAGTKVPRIAAPNDLQGVTGDPWTPVNKTESKALTVGAGGFSYRLLKDILLSGEYVASPAMDKDGLEENGGFLVATALVRGQGKTEGFHHRVVPVPAKAARIFGEPSRREKLALRAEQRVEVAAIVQRNVLYPALRALLSAGSDEQVDSGRLRRWTDAFDAAVDDVFFEDLWEAIDLPPEQARRRWEQRLHRFARQQLEDAIGACPLPSIRRYRAISTAESIFHGAVRNNLTELFEDTEQEEEHEPVAGC